MELILLIVYPTRLARHGGALVLPNEGKRYINLNNSSYFSDENPIDATCNCYGCKTFSRAYLHILLKNDEHLAQMVLTEHNISFMNRFISIIRQSISDDKFDKLKDEWTI